MPRNSSSNPCTSSKSPFMELTSAGMTSNPGWGAIWSTWLSGVHICFRSENSFVGLGVYRCGCTYRFKNKMQFVSMCRVCVGVSCAGVFVLYQYHLDLHNLHSEDSNKPNKPKYEHVLLLPGAGMTVRIWASSVLPQGCIDSSCLESSPLVNRLVHQITKLSISTYLLAMQQL